MGLYSSPPPLHSFAEDKPTLLVCWWITFFCSTIILLRLAGRFIRSERLFAEDRVVALAMLPLFFRMGCVHVILKFGTNNADFSAVTLSESELHRRSVASGLVLASRIFHAATLWILKLTILEFFKRINDALLERFSRVAYSAIRYCLAATFVAIVISDLAECRPFSHYRQVLPDPGGQCRQGYAQLVTMSACNILTDLLLVFFPIPVIMFSHQALKRRIQFILLFSLSLGVVGVTVYRVTHVIRAHGSQQLRSLLASVELLFATAAANAIVLGSFVRDRGHKKNKFRNGSVVDSMDRSSIARSRRPTMNRHWGSDEDLVRGLGLGVHRDLQNSPDLATRDDVIFGNVLTGRPNPHPLVRVSDSDGQTATANAGDGLGLGYRHDRHDRHDRHEHDAHLADMSNWQFPDAQQSASASSRTQSTWSGQSESDVLLRDPPNASPRTTHIFPPRKVSFYDVGGLLSSESEDSANSANSAHPANLADSAHNTHNTSSANTVRSYTTSVTPHGVPPSPAYTAGSHGFRRGSSTVLHDLSGLQSPDSSGSLGSLGSSGSPESQRAKAAGKAATTVPDLYPVLQESPLESPLASPTFMESPPSPSRSSISAASSSAPIYRSQNLDDIVLMDAGGLLSPPLRRH